MKELFVLVSDSGDGSYSTCYTFNKDWITNMEKLQEHGDLEYDDIGCDGDGFHYNVLIVPDECTLETLGIQHDCGNEG